MIFFKYIFFAVLCVVSLDADASEMAVFQRDLYDRVIIENALEGDVEISDNQLSIPFADAIGKAIPLQSRTIQSITQTDSTATLILNGAVTDTRNFRIGNRIILDVFFDADKISAQPTPIITPIPTPVIEADDVAEVAEVVKEVEKPVTVLEAPSIAETIEPVIVAEPAPELPVVEILPPLAGASIITISSTKPFGLTVFERFGRLFIVTDQSDMGIPPQVSGSGAKLGWVMTEIPMTNGKAWSMPVPDNSYFRPEGRGLIWRVVISDIDPELSTVGIRRRNTDPKNPLVDILISDSSKLLRFTDPDYGDDLAIVTVKKATSRMMIPYDFVDFDILPAVIGTVIKPESDGIRIASGDQFVTVSKADGLALANDPQDKIIDAYLNNSDYLPNVIQPTETTLDRVFYFPDWGGGIKPYEYADKRKELDQFLALASTENKLGVILDLVKLTLSQGMGQEALGYLDLAANNNQQIEETSEYQALRGAAHYLASQYDVAVNYFDGDELKNISEAQLWYAASLASLGNNEKALAVYNNNAVLTSVYPYSVKRVINAPLALAALNENNGKLALEFIELIDKPNDMKTPEERATVAYLKGRAQSVTGRPDEAISNLYKASLGSKLGPYGIRAELLLIKDELAREVLPLDEAIQRMERLRFAWRGDELESEIYQSLGALYIENGEPRKGLGILKRAATNTQSVQDRRATVRKMADAYKSIFIGEDFEKTDPLVAVTVYDEFKELTPIGEEGNQLIDRLADKLMSISMMSRATQVLKDKMDRLGEGQHAIKTGLRIAAIQLLDREPEMAMETLLQVDTMIGKYRGDDKAELNSKIVLLKARSLAETGQPEQALFMTEGLDDTDDVIRLRIDTAWKTGQWVAVTDNLAKLLARENITSANPPTAQQAQLILNQAVALTLSNQYDALQRFASAYDTVMKQTPNYKTFLLVSRPQNISNLADRETLLDVTSEVDLFQSFLEKLEK